MVQPLHHRTDMASFDLNLNTRASLIVDGEPSAYITEHHGEVVCIDDTTGAETVAGRVHAYRLHAGLALEHGESLFDVCDSHSSEMNAVHALLFQPEKYELKTSLVERFGAREYDVLDLDYIVLDPKWRKLKLGLLVARKVIDLLGGGCGLVVSHIAPLRRKSHPQFNVPADWIPHTESNEAGKIAPVRLRGYFRQMGFERLGRTPYYAMSTSHKTPTGEELLKPRANGG